MTSDDDVRGRRRYREETRVVARVVHEPRALMLVCSKRLDLLFHFLPRGITRYDASNPQPHCSSTPINRPSSIRYLQRNNNHESRGWTEDQMYIISLSFIYIYQRDSAIIRDSRFENVINNLDFKVYIYTYILCNNIRIYIHIVLKN